MNNLNIEYYIKQVTTKYGKNVISSILARYDATTLEDLAPSHYAEVLDDLMLMDEDD